MKRLLCLFTALALLALHACTTGTSNPPTVSPAVVASGVQSHASEQELTFGRSLFVQRCIQCHALPEIRAHSADEWPKLISEMADRAHLKAEEKQAVLVYLLAARSTL